MIEPLQSPKLFPSSPTAVLPKESAVESAPVHSTENPTPAPFLCDIPRHAHWQPERERIARAIFDAGLSMSRLTAFAGCGEGVWILRDKENPARFKLVPDHCHDRFCKPCAAARSRIVARNVADLLEDQPARHITFTLKHRKATLAEQIDRLYAAYRRLRQRQLWKDRVDGAAAMLEVTWNDDNHTWHPHLHVIAVGGFIPLGDLRAAWLGVTGDSHIVDIKLVRNAKATASYVAKYATKSIDSDLTNYPGPLKEAILALKGRRAIVTSGSWAKARLTKPPTDKQWSCLCHANELFTARHVPDELVDILADWLRDVRNGTAEPLAVLPIPLPPTTKGPSP